MKNIFGINENLDIHKSKNYEIVNKGTHSCPFYSYTFNESGVTIEQPYVFDNMGDCMNKVNSMIENRQKTIQNKIEELTKEFVELESKKIPKV